MAMLLGIHDECIDDDFGCSLLAPMSRDEIDDDRPESCSLLAPMSAGEMPDD